MLLLGFYYATILISYTYVNNQQIETICTTKFDSLGYLKTYFFTCCIFLSI